MDPARSGCDAALDVFLTNEDAFNLLFVWLLHSHPVQAEIQGHSQIETDHGLGSTLLSKFLDEVFDEVGGMVGEAWRSELRVAPNVNVVAERRYGDPTRVGKRPDITIEWGRHTVIVESKIRADPASAFEQLRVPADELAGRGREVGLVLLCPASATATSTVDALRANAPAAFSTHFDWIRVGRIVEAVLLEFQSVEVGIQELLRAFAAKVGCLAKVVSDRPLLAATGRPAESASPATEVPGHFDERATREWISSAEMLDEDARALLLELESFCRGEGGGIGGKRVSKRTETPTYRFRVECDGKSLVLFNWNGVSGYTHRLNLHLGRFKDRVGYSGWSDGHIRLRAMFGPNLDLVGHPYVPIGAVGLHLDEFKVWVREFAQRVR